MSKKFINLEQSVKTILSTVPLTRDSDEALYAQLLKFQGFSTESITAQQLLEGMHNGTHISWESVTRWRRRIQEKCPETRGKNYEKRHQYQSDVKETLGYIETPFGSPGLTP